MAGRVWILLPLALVCGCGLGDGEPAPKDLDADWRSSLALVVSKSLQDARREYTPRPVPDQPRGNPVPQPPPNVFELVRYESPVGPLAAYVSPNPGDGQRHPAIVWITGGDCNSIDDLWSDAPRENDQTAAAYRRAGIIMMFPSLRGGNDNPGKKEGFYGEVDDVLAAADFLAKQDYVDPQRIYLGGHSTGGTLAMLVAESTDRFRAVFSFGPAESVDRYPAEYTPFDATDSNEVALRSPGRWLSSVGCPLFVIEGRTGNSDSLKAMERASQNPKIQFFPLTGGDHFTILAPVNELIASKILQDTGPTLNINLSRDELNAIVR